MYIICMEKMFNPIGGVMVSLLASRLKNAIFISTALRSKGWLARNHDNVSELNEMSTRGLLFQSLSAIYRSN